MARLAVLGLFVKLMQLLLGFQLLLQVVGQVVVVVAFCSCLLLQVVVPLKPIGFAIT
jgi:hypothetical protein